MDLPTFTMAVLGANRPIYIDIASDVEQVLDWARKNWGTAPYPASTRIAVLGGQPARYGLPDSLSGSRWWNPRRRVLAQFNGRSYAVVKNAVRAVASLLATPQELFVHGCAITIGSGPRPAAALVIGSSGAGKTTLVSRLMAGSDPSVRIINDDWGVVDLDSMTALFTGERLLHMTAQSVHAFRSDIVDRGWPSIAFERPLDPRSPQMRVFIPQDEVFGDAIAGEGRVRFVAFVSREKAPPSDASLDAVLDAVQQGAYSVHYKRHEAFFNGALLADEHAVAVERAKYEQLLTKANFAWIRNDGTPAQLEEQFRNFLAS